MAFDLLSDRLDRGVRAQEPVGQRLVFAQQPEQQVLRLNVRRTELAGLVAREEDHSPGFFRVAFKHLCSLSERPRGPFCLIPKRKSPSSSPRLPDPGFASEGRRTTHRIGTSSFPRL